MKPHGQGPAQANQKEHALGAKWALAFFVANGPGIADISSFQRAGGLKHKLKVLAGRPWRAAEMGMITPGIWVEFSSQMVRWLLRYLHSSDGVVQSRN